MLLKYFIVITICKDPITLYVDMCIYSHNVVIYATQEREKLSNIRDIFRLGTPRMPISSHRLCVIVPTR